MYFFCSEVRRYFLNDLRQLKSVVRSIWCLVVIEVKKSVDFLRFFGKSGIVWDNSFYVLRVLYVFIERVGTDIIYVRNSFKLRSDASNSGTISFVVCIYLSDGWI